jgi:hypothetical protein
MIPGDGKATPEIPPISLASGMAGSTHLADQTGFSNTTADL